MPIVESHVHIWTQHENYPFSPTLPDVPVPSSDATAEMLLAETGQAGVDHVVLVQPSTTVGTIATSRIALPATRSSLPASVW